MINGILILLIAIVVIFAVKNSIKHFKGEGPCCSGGSGVLLEKKKLENPVIERATVFTEGMKCSECAKRLWNSLNKTEGLSVKKVNFKKGTAVFESSRNISESEIKDAVESAGYKFIKVCAVVVPKGGSQNQSKATAEA